MGFPACRLGSALHSFGLCGGRVIEGSRLHLGVLEFALLWTLWRLERSVTPVAWCAAP